MVRRYIRPCRAFCDTTTSVIDSSSNHRCGRAEEETAGGVGKEGMAAYYP